LILWQNQDVLKFNILILIKFIYAPTSWSGAKGLAEDVRRYGYWMREEAFKRIGHLYPQVDLPAEYGGSKATVIAWLWARTVKSPNPAFSHVDVPLISTFILSSKKTVFQNCYC
jgi:putative DNA methylase